MLTRLLKAEYNRRSLLKPLPWENTFKLPLGDVYTRLTIVSRRKTDFMLEENEVNMFDIFTTLNKGEDAMVLVEGSPGIGKTTFCLKISHDWANKKIPNESSFPVFKLLLLLKCRDIHGDIMEAIVDQLLPEDVDEKAKKKIIDYIKDIHNQESILIILDGLDELPKTAESHVDKLLGRRILPFCYVLATSRQERGIVVRQKVDFDVLLQIEGFTKADSFEYIRKHFSHFGPDHVQKGERLILAIHKNTFLDALPCNPLNVLLLCVIFEDYHGNLPSSRTELYQIIISCLLRRYCAKHDLEAPADDKELEEKFEDSLLALGELAWRCLQDDRFSFREEELARFESSIKNLAARKLGLVFKEASVRKINPQHEYHFFHKTFQEYLAALYLVHKILEQQTSVCCEFQLNFRKDISQRYQQVFIFMSGILGKDASILFGQIGEMLKGENWNWLQCNKEQATFFTECLSESRNAEQVAMALFSFIPFPMTVTIDLSDKESPKDVLAVANASKSFSQLQLPVHLNVYNLGFIGDVVVADFLASYSRLQTLLFSLWKMTQNETTLLCKAIRVNSALYSFTLKAFCRISSDAAVAIGDSLAANKTMNTVTFKLMGECGEAWATALEKGLSADTPLTSVLLEIYGSMSETAMGALKKVLFNRSLTSLGLTIYGDMQDSLATTVGEGLAADSSLKSLTLIVYGNLSCSGATLLKNGVLENNSLTSLELKVFGELPDNWLNISETVCCEKKSSMSCLVYPNVIGKITNAHVTCLCPVLEENLVNLKLKSLTLNIWGELKISGANDLCKLLIVSAVSCVNLIINGRVTTSLANCLVEHFNKLSTLSDLGINIRGELTRDANSVLQALSCNQKYAFTLNVHGLNADDKIYKEVNLSADDSSSLTSVLDKVNDTCPSRLSLNINPKNLSDDWGCTIYEDLGENKSLTTLDLILNNHGNTSGDWTLGLGNGLAQNTSLTTLNLTLNNYSDMSVDWRRGLGNGLLQNTSLTTPNLTLNSHIDMSGVWTRGLGDGLAQNTSLTTLSLVRNNYSDMSADWTLGLGNGLAQNTSLTTLNLRLNNYSGMSGDWTRGLGNGLAQNTSLTTLSLTLNNYSDMSGVWTRCLGDGLVQNTSLTTPNLTVNTRIDMSRVWTRGLGDGLAQNTSLTTLSLIRNNYSDMSADWTLGLGNGLAQNTSLTTLNLTLNNYSDMSGDWTRGLGNGLAQNTSLTTLSLTLNNHRDMSGDWTRGLGDGLARNTSLTTLNLTLNNYGDMSGDWTHGLGDGLARNTSLTTLSLTLNNYSDMSGDWTRGLGDGLARNTSLTTLNLTLNNYSDLSGDWTDGLGDGLAQNTSLTTLSITLNNYSDISGDWTRGLGDGLARNTSLTTLSLTLNNYCDMSGDWTHGLGDGSLANASLFTPSRRLKRYSDMSGDWTRGLGDGLAQNTSLTTLNLTLNNYSDMSGDWTRGLGDGLARNTSLTTLNLTLNNYSDMSGDWTHGLGDGLARNTSLTTLNLTLNNYSDMSGNWTRGLGDGLARNTSLTTLKLTLNNYSDTSVHWAWGLGYGLAENTSLTTLSLTVSNYSDTSGGWTRGLGDGLAQNTSLTTLSLTLSNYSDTSGDWGLDLLDGLARNKSIGESTLTLNSCNNSVYEGWVRKLGKGLAMNTTLTTICLEVNVFGERNENSESGLG